MRAALIGAGRGGRRSALNQLLPFSFNRSPHKRAQPVPVRPTADGRHPTSGDRHNSNREGRSLMRHVSRTLTLLVLAAAVARVDATTTVFTENFDSAHTANWNYVPSAGTAINEDFINDGYGSDANIFYDYSQVGVPSAPGSTGGSTTGMK